MKPKTPHWDSINWRSADTVIAENTKRLEERYAKAGYTPRSSRSVSAASPKPAHIPQ